MSDKSRRDSSTYGFKLASGLLGKRIRAGAEARGFAESRLLTRWPEIAGEAIAAIARPVEVSYARKGFGATLTLLTTGANAPRLEMEKEAIRARVNACYGYNAISRIRITQSAPTGFAEGAVAFGAAPPAAGRMPDREAAERAVELARGAESTDLRLALSELGANVLSRDRSRNSRKDPAR